MLQRKRRFSDFDISLEIKNETFLNPPRQVQRNWLLGKAIEEFADNLMHLDEIARQLVPGSEAVHEQAADDRTHAKLDAQNIMEDWQIPLMEAMARAVTRTPNHILEVGFGRGVSATFLQEFGVKSHTIIECNPYVIEHFFTPWRQQYPDQEICLVQGLWQDVIHDLGMFDGIFFHTSILNQKDFLDHLVNSVTFAAHFFPVAAEHLRAGGVFTYLTNEIDSLSRAQQRLIFQYFRSFSLSVQPLTIPEDVHDLWWANSMAVVTAVK